MILRKAEKKDIAFIVNAILEIEAKGSSNTYNHLFSTSTEVTAGYLTQFFLDEENTGTELSLDSFSVAEIAGETAGCCALIHTDQTYYQNKGELFPIHLSPEDLMSFIGNVNKLPSHREDSENKYFIEYIFVGENFRRRGIAEKMIGHQLSKIPTREAYINLFTNNQGAYNCYRKIGFSEFRRVAIDSAENSMYPTVEKIIMRKDI